MATFQPDLNSPLLTYTHVLTPEQILERENKSMVLKIDYLQREIKTLELGLSIKQERIDTITRENALLREINELLREKCS